MQDTEIVPNFYAYSFRYDIQPAPFFIGPHTLPFLTVKEWDAIFPKIKRDYLDLLEGLPFIHFYLASLEVGTLTKKPHIQSIVWAPYKLSIKEMQSVRNRTRSKYDFEKNDAKLAFSSAKKVRSLASYCAKDDSELITNLPTESLGMLDQWVDSNNFSSSLKSTLERKIKEIAIPNMSFHRFCSAFNELFLSIHKRPCCRRATYFKYALKHGVISQDVFLERIGVLERSNNKTCNYCSGHSFNIKI